MQLRTSVTYTLKSSLVSKLSVSPVNERYGHVQWPEGGVRIAFRYERVHVTFLYPQQIVVPINEKANILLGDTKVYRNKLITVGDVLLDH